MPKPQFEKFNVRGFHGFRFQDRYGTSCSLQESSAASEPCIWIGAEEGLLPGDGPPWPEQKRHVLARMHLNQEQVRALLPALVHFAEAGELPDALPAASPAPAAPEDPAYDGLNVRIHNIRAFVSCCQTQKRWNPGRTKAALVIAASDLKVLEGLLREAVELLVGVHEGECPRHWYHSRQRELAGASGGDCTCGVDAWLSRARAALGEGVPHGG